MSVESKHQTVCPLFKHLMALSHCKSQLINICRIVQHRAVLALKASLRDMRAVIDPLPLQCLLPQQASLGGELIYCDVIQRFQRSERGSPNRPAHSINRAKHTSRVIEAWTWRLVHIAGRKQFSGCFMLQRKRNLSIWRSTGSSRTQYFFYTPHVEGTKYGISSFEEDVANVILRVSVWVMAFTPRPRESLFNWFADFHPSWKVPACASRRCAVTIIILILTTALPLSCISLFLWETRQECLIRSERRCWIMQLLWILCFLCSVTLWFTISLSSYRIITACQHIVTELNLDLNKKIKK